MSLLACQTDILSLLNALVVYLVEWLVSITGACPILVKPLARIEQGTL